MKHDIAVAATRAKKRVHAGTGKPDNSLVLDETSRFGINILFYGGIAIGAGGLLCLISGMVKSGGPLAFMKGWLIALLGS